MTSDAKCPSTRIAVGICTRDRTAQLKVLLELIAQQIRSAREEGQEAHIVVVDNSANGTARAPVENFSSRWPDIVLSYELESRPGVGYARKRLLDTVKRSADDLVIFDDDQVPADDWLSQFISARGRHPGCVLVGPVVPEFVTELPRWAAGGWAWGDRDKADGYRYQYAGFGNILIPARILVAHAVEVPRRFFNFPGEDTVITGRLSKEGVAIVHVSRARAVETVEANRITLRWVVNRFRRSGIAWALVCDELEVPRYRFVGTICKSIVKTCYLLLSPSSTSYSVSFSKGAAELFRVVGFVQGHLAAKAASYRAFRTTTHDV